MKSCSQYLNVIVDTIAGIGKRTLMRHYGFTDEELKFIINYDIKYRMGKSSADEETD